MKRLCFIGLLSASLIFLISGISSAKPEEEKTDERLAALEDAVMVLEYGNFLLRGSVEILQDKVEILPDDNASLQTEIINLQNQLNNFTLAEHSVGSYELAESIFLGDSSQSGFLQINHWSGGRGFRASTSSDFANKTGRVVIGSSGSDHVNVDFYIHDPYHDETGDVSAALFFDADKAMLEIGSTGGADKGGTPGLVRVMNEDRSKIITLRGETGDAYQSVEGNGFVRAWAHVDGDTGDVIKCYRCLPSGTSRFGEGSYLVDFSPVAEDVWGFPIVATLYLGGEYADADLILVSHAIKDGVELRSKVLVLTYSEFDVSDCDSFYIALF